MDMSYSKAFAAQVSTEGNVDPVQRKQVFAGRELIQTQVVAIVTPKGISVDLRLIVTLPKMIWLPKI